MQLKLKDNKLDIEVSVSMAKMAFGDNTEQLQMARDIATECANETDADRCEAAFKIMLCGERGARARGLIFD